MFHSWKSTQPSPSTLPAPSYSLLPTAHLVTPRRWDLAVKFRFFQSRLGGSDLEEAERIYCWHIEQRSGHRMRQGIATDLWKLTLDDYVAEAEALLWAVKAFGFLFPDPRGRNIRVDPNGELKDGSHRVACALALGIEELTVQHDPELAWAPPWGEAWFIDHGMADEDLERLRQDWASIYAR